MMTSDGGKNSQDFELNLAPIIDCFTVLITYLLVSASFLSLSVLDIGITATGEKAADAVAPTEIPISVSLYLRTNHTVEIKVSGGPKKISETSVLATNAEGSWNSVELKTKITELLKRWPTFKEVNMSAEPQIQYKDLVKIIEELKPLLPNIYLAG